MSTIQAIARRSVTETFTFTEIPSEAVRKQLFEKGFRYRNGQWFRNQQDSGLVEEEVVAASIAA